MLTLALIGSTLTLVAFASHSGKFLEVEPEDGEFTEGQTVILIAQLTEPTSDEVNIDFENEGGANDKDGGDFPLAPLNGPDLSCSINDPLTPEPSPTVTNPPSQDEQQCTVTYRANAIGTDTWRAWIDHDNSNTTDESDADEGPNGDQSRGPAGQPQAGFGDDCADPTDPEPPLFEPDCTDVVKITISEEDAGSQAKVDCDDSGSGTDTERETNPSGGSGSSENYNCSVFDSGDNATSGTVYGEVENSVNDPDGTDGASHSSPDYVCSAGSSGECDITVTQNEGELGTADICFWLPTDSGDDHCDSEQISESGTNGGADTANDGADRVAKTWAIPSSGSATRSSTPSGGSSGAASPSGSQSAKPTKSSTPSNGGPADRSVTLTSSDDQVRSGQSVTFSGSVSSSDSDCESGETVILKRRVHGTTTDEEIERVTSDNTGSFSTLVVVRKNADYVVEVEPTDDCEFAASNSVTVEANAKVRDIGVNDRTPKRGSRVVVSGQIVPQQDGTRAVLKRKRGTRWVKVDTDVLNDRSRARFVFKAGWTGKRLFRIYWFPQNESNERARSKAFRIRAHR